MSWPVQINRPLYSAWKVSRLWISLTCEEREFHSQDITTQMFLSIISRCFYMGSVSLDIQQISIVEVIYKVLFLDYWCAHFGGRDHTVHSIENAVCHFEGAGIDCWEGLSAPRMQESL